MTTAMKLAQIGINPSKLWIHNSELIDDNGFKVRDYLKQKGIEVDNQWKYIAKQENTNISDEIKQKLNEYCKEYDIQNQQLIINYPEYQKYDWDDTFAVYLEIHNIEIPKQFLYNPEYKLNCGITTAMLIALKGIIPSKVWHHKPELQDNNEQTVAMYLAIENKIPPQEWQHDPQLQNSSKYTVALLLAQNGVTPPQEWEHDKDIKNKYGFTVQDYLESNNIQVLDQWKTIDCKIQNKKIIKYLCSYCKKYDIDKDIIIINPSWQDNIEQETFAMYLVYKLIIPPKQFIHDPNINNYHGYNVRIRLLHTKLPVPNEWYDDEYKQNHEYEPDCINDAFYGILTNRPENIKSESTCVYRWTVAMIYAHQGIIPPKRWEHDSSLQNYSKETVAMLLAKNKIFDISKQWQHNPTLQDKDGNTVAMLLVQNKIIPPQEWNHNSELQDFWGNTVAILLAKNGIIPPKQWQYNPYIPDQDQKTVQDYLIENNINIPDQWKVIDKQIEMTSEIKQYLKKYCKGYYIKNQQIVINYPQYQKNNTKITFAMYLAYNGIIPPKEFEHDPNIKHYQGLTVAMCLAWNKIIPPVQWQVNPNIIYKYRDDNDTHFERTIALELSSNGIIPSKEWQHDPQLTDNYGNTVGILLSSKGIIPPQQWMHDINIKNNKNDTIKSNLQQWGYIYTNNEFIKLNLNNIKQYIQTEILDDICQICFEEGEQEFIKTNCKHRICIDCFIEMIKINKQKLFCPICRQEQWFQLIDQLQ